MNEANVKVVTVTKTRSSPARIQRKIYDIKAYHDAIVNAISILK